MGGTMEAKRTVMLEERNGSLILGDKEYRSPLDRSVSLEASDFTIHWRADYDLVGNRIDQGSYSISGTARLTGDRIGVIGVPENHTQQLSSLSTTYLRFGSTSQRKRLTRSLRRCEPTP